MDSFTNNQHFQQLDLSQAWERRPGEPERWFARFERYCLQDPGYRSLSAVWMQEKRKEGQERKSGKPSQHWETAARRWAWAERAAAWDQYRRERALAGLERSWIELLELVPAAVETLMELLCAEESGQRRMAAESILRLSGLGDHNKQEDPDAVTPITVVRVRGSTEVDASDFGEPS